MTTPLNRSVPTHLTAPPRPLTAIERAELERIADTLIPGTADDPAPSVTQGYPDSLDRALAARADAFDDIITLAASLAATPAAALEGKLRRLSNAEPDRFQTISAVLAGAYLTIPEVRRRIGYPGQERKPAPFDQAADEIMDGILDAVLERGSCYMPAPD